jgi:hypothetical protein
MKKKSFIVDIEKNPEKILKTTVSFPFDKSTKILKRRKIVQYITIR